VPTTMTFAGLDVHARSTHDAAPIGAPKARSRWLTFLLTANLLLVAAAAISAIVFLVAAWLN